MLQSRLSRRLRANGLSSFREYYSMLTKDGASKTEVTEFINAVTTNKTDFFREPHHFEFITNTLIPEIEQKAPYGARRLNVWHAGCSTGGGLPLSLTVLVFLALGPRRRRT